jgi:hypothetical protein
MKGTVVRIFVVLLVLSAGCAGAQEQGYRAGEVGIIAGAGLYQNLELSMILEEEAWAGSVVHLSPWLAARPSVAVYGALQVTEDLPGPTPPHVSRNSIGLDASVAGLYTFPAAAGLSLYAGPEVEYLCQHTTQFFSDGDVSELMRYHILRLTALFGVQYMLSPRFGFVADLSVGVLWYWQHDTSWDALGAVLGDNLTTTTFYESHGACLGALFYLR